jgi:hypothetical protein
MKTFQTRWNELPGAGAANCHDPFPFVIFTFLNTFFYSYLRKTDNLSVFQSSWRRKWHTY